MLQIQSSGYFQNGIIYWELDRNQFEFTQDEFTELLEKQAQNGLFTYLENQRPNTMNQILALFSANYDSEDEKKELEYFLEQCLIDLQRKIVRYDGR